jgi:hypothetical protein
VENGDVTRGNVLDMDLLSQSQQSGNLKGTYELEQTGLFERNATDPMQTVKFAVHSKAGNVFQT